MLELRKVQTTSDTTSVVINHSEFSASLGQTDFLLNATYTLETNSIQVFLNGVLQRNLDDYIELNSSTIRFIKPLMAGDKVTCREIR